MTLKKSLTFIFLTISFSNAFAQIIDANYKNSLPKENSPLSRVGLGNISNQYLTANSGMGGLTAAYRDESHFNPFNPASIATLRTTAYEVGIFAKNNQVKTPQGQAAAWNGNLNYLGLAFPTYSVINEVLDRKPREVRWGMGVSLMPYSTVGYNIGTTNLSPAGDSTLVNNYFLGSGGTYRLMLGNGVSYKGLSVGANVGYVFGKMNYLRQLILSDSLRANRSTYFDDNYSLRGFNWNIGVQYDITLDPKSKYGDKGGRKHLVLGAYGNPEHSFTTNATQFYRRFNSNSSTRAEDTLLNVSGVQGQGVLPSEWTFGVMYEQGLTLKIGAEYKFVGWSAYKNDIKPDVLTDANRISIGAEFILDKNKLKTEEEKVRYRLGFYTGKDGRSLNGVQVENWAATGGLCLPLRVGRGQQLSYMNVGLEYGQFNAGALTENYFRINVGFTLNDNSWFLKRKFQ